MTTSTVGSCKLMAPVRLGELVELLMVVLLFSTVVVFSFELEIVEEGTTSKIS